MINIDFNKCTHCQKCVDVCPARIFSYQTSEEKKEELKTINQHLCILCGHCVAICPDDAILHDGLSPELFLPLELPKIAPESLRNLMLSRRSIRAYEAGLVPRNLVDQLIDVAVHAGTASNRQNVQFTVVQDKTLLLSLEDLVVGILWKQLKKLGNPLIRRLARLRYSEEDLQAYYRYYLSFKRSVESKTFRGTILRGAPAVIVVHTPGKSTLDAANCALAIANMTMMAQPLELGVCWAGFLVEAAHRSSSQVNGILQIPKSHHILGALLVGYPKHHYSMIIRRKPPQVEWL
ncbi:MAG: nitroreductase family protein [Candidatus Thorarchaeota archaeon]